jgi:hypothetical protein
MAFFILLNIGLLSTLVRGSEGCFFRNGFDGQDPVWGMPGNGITLQMKNLNFGNFTPFCSVLNRDFYNQRNWPSLDMDRAQEPNLLK